MPHGRRDMFLFEFINVMGLPENDMRCHACFDTHA